MLSVTSESVNLDLEMRRNNLCYLFVSARLCGSASKLAPKHGTGGAAADRSQGYHSAGIQFNVDTWITAS